MHKSDELTIEDWKQALPNYENFNKKQWKQVYPEFIPLHKSYPPTVAKMKKDAAEEGFEVKPNSNYERNPRYDKLNTKTKRRIYPEIEPYLKKTPAKS